MWYNKYTNKKGGHKLETLLLTIGFIGIILMLLTPWTKTGGLIAFGGVVGYFYFAGVESWTPIILLILGLALMVTEVFIPDFGLIGILGILTIAFGLYLTTGDFGLMIRDLSVALLTSAVIVVLLIKNGYSLSNLNKLVLHAASKEPVEVEMREEKPQLSIGMEGIAKTPLRPSGKVEFEEMPNAYDVLSGEGHIDLGSKVIIQEVHGTKIVVRKQK